MQGLTGGYKALQWVSAGYKELRGLQGLHWATGGYRRLQGVTEGYKALPEVTGDFEELQEVTGGLQEVTGCYKGLPKSGGKAKSTSGESTKKRLSIVPGLERCSFFYATSSESALSSYLSIQLFTRRFSSGGVSCCLLGSGHDCETDV